MDDLGCATGDQAANSSRLRTTRRHSVMPAPCRSSHRHGNGPVRCRTDGRCRGTAQESARWRSGRSATCSRFARSGRGPAARPACRSSRSCFSAHFEKLGGKVTLQKFHAANPLGGANVPMANMIVEWHPERKERILLCAHYDTRPLPDRDPDPVQATHRHVHRRERRGERRGRADGTGAPDAEARRRPSASTFCSCDGEELVYVDGRDPYFLGSTWFAQQYVRKPPQHKYRWGVVLDMVGDTKLADLPGAAQRDVARHAAAGERDLGDGGSAGREGVHSAREVPGAGRSPAAAQHRQDSDVRHHRFRLPSLAHDDGYAAAVLARRRWRRWGGWCMNG